MKKSHTDILFYAFFVAFLGTFLIYPLWGVFSKALFFNNQFSPGLFWHTLTGPGVLSATGHSFALAIVTVTLSTCIALPLALVVSNYEFRFKTIASGLVLVPMIMPPFVGAVGIRRIFARYGMLNLTLGTEPFDWFGETGLIGVALLQSLHLFPIMYLNVTAALSNIDPQLHEAARVCGARKWRVFRDVTFPLMTPGFLSGAVIVFLWAFTDLGTPLVIGYRSVLALEIFDRVASINNDPTGSVMVVFVLAITVALMFSFKGFFSSDKYTASTKGYRSQELRNPSKVLLAAIYAYVAIVLALSLLPHVGLILTSIAQTWFVTPLPTDITLEFYGAALHSEGVVISVRNSVLYSAASTTIDVVLGILIAYFVLRRKIKAGWVIDSIVMLPIALPGLILAFGYVATFSGTILDPLKNPVPLLIIGYAVRRLPFCFRAAYAGLQQIGVEYEEASRICGASQSRTIRTITAPLIAANILAGGILAFMFAVLEVSESMILAVKKEFFPVTRQIYQLLGKIPDGDYVASALGVLCMLFLAAGLITASALMGKRLGRMFRA